MSRNTRWGYPHIKKVVKDAEWKRISEKAGITSISGHHCYPYLEDVCQKFIKNILHKATIYMDYSKRKTLYPEDVVEAINMSGFTKMFVDPRGDVKKCKIKEAKRSLTRVRSYQQQSDCFMIAKKPFHDFIKEEIKESDPSIRTSSESITVLHYAFESFALSLLMAAADAMAHARRVTLFVDDLKLVSRNLSLNCAKIILK